MQQALSQLFARLPQHAWHMSASREAGCTTGQRVDQLLREQWSTRARGASCRRPEGAGLLQLVLVAAGATRYMYKLVPSMW